MNVTAAEPVLTADAVADAYQWIDCSNGFSMIAGETGQAFTAAVNGDYAVIVTQNGCVDTSSCHTVMSVGIESAGNANSFSIYPNPAASNISIEITASASQEAEIMLFSSAGQLVAIERVNLIAGKNTREYNTQEYARGVYFIKLISEGNVIIKKLVLN